MKELTGLQHFRKAEALLALVPKEQDAAWSAVLAATALAHATLAAAAADYGLHVAPSGSTKPTTVFIPAAMEEKIVFQGDAVKRPRARGTKKKSDGCGEPFTLKNQISLIDLLRDGGAGE